MYVDRNNAGAIVAIYAVPQRNGQEFVASDSPEITAFLAQINMSAAQLHPQE